MDMLRDKNYLEDLWKNKSSMENLGLKMSDQDRKNPNPNFGKEKGF